MNRVALAVAVALAAVAGCSGSSDDGGTTKRHSLSEHGFSISVPSDWKTVKPDEVLASGELEQFQEDNPEIAHYVDAIAKPDAPIKFLAFDPDAKADFATNLNVVVLPLPGGVSFDQWAKAAAAEVENLPTRSAAVDEQRIDLPAGESLFLEYEQEFSVEGSVRMVSTTQYGLVAGRRVYVLTFTTLPDQLASYGSVFRSVADSLKLTA